MVSASVAVMALRYAWRLRTDGYHALHIQFALAIAVFALGESVIRGWVWWWRHLKNDGRDVAWMDGYPVLAIGIALGIWSGLCLIRAFCRRGWAPIALLVLCISLYLAL